MYIVERQIRIGAYTMKVYNGNGHIEDTGVTQHATLRRRPALRIDGLGESDTEPAPADTVIADTVIGNEQVGNDFRISIAIVPSIDTGAEGTGDVECVEVPSQNEALDGDAKAARRGAARHARRAGYAVFACCAAWTACSAMGADFGIVNGATGQGAAALAAFIIAAAIAKKSVGMK